jgi:hypothetical protein
VNVRRGFLRAATVIWAVGAVSVLVIYVSRSDMDDFRFTAVVDERGKWICEGDRPGGPGTWDLIEEMRRKVTGEVLGDCASTDDRWCIEECWEPDLEHPILMTLGMLLMLEAGLAAVVWVPYGLLMWIVAGFQD